MRIKYLLILSLLSACGSDKNLVTSYEPIINGAPCSENLFPASLALIQTKGSSYSSFCGATLIAPDVAVTAAHCVKKLFKPSYQQQNQAQYFVTSKSDLTHLYDTEFDSDSEKTIQIHAVVIHKGYTDFKDSGPDNDIALLFLTRQSTLQPAQILTPWEADSLKTGATTLIVGWGQRQVGAKGLVRTESIKHCAVSFLNHTTPFDLHVGSNGNNPRKCFGDSGGASYIRSSETFKLVGITSIGIPGDDDCQEGTVDTRIDAYYDWIFDTLDRECQMGGHRLFCPF